MTKQQLDELKNINFMLGSMFSFIFMILIVLVFCAFYFEQGLKNVGFMFMAFTLLLVLGVLYISNRKTISYELKQQKSG